MVKEKPHYVLSAEGRWVLLIVRTVKVEVSVPEGVSGLELDVSHLRLRLLSDVYELELGVEELSALVFCISDKKKARIDEASTKAKHQKKRNKLMITLMIKT